MPKPALWALLVVVPLTLGMRSIDQGVRAIDYQRLTDDATASLTAGGWSARPRKHPVLGSLIEGTRGDCRILVHFAWAEGGDEAKFRKLAQTVGPVTYQYRGETSAGLPRFLPMIAQHVQGYAWSFGLTLPTAPLISAARSPSCGTQAPDFTALRQYLAAPRAG